GHKLAEMDLLPFLVLCPEGLVLSAYIVLDHFIGSIQDILGGTIILLQTDDHSIWKNLFKAENISDIGSAEFIDRLVIVSHHAEISVFGSQETDKFELGSVGILVFVHHDIAETFLVIVQHIRTCLEKLYRFYDQII